MSDVLGGTMLVLAQQGEFARLDLPQDALWLLRAALLVYLLVLFGVSIIATQRVQTEEDYLVAGRKLPLFLAWGTLIATWFGAATMAGTAQAAREQGLLGVILDPFACSATLVFAGLCFAAPMWRLKLLTTADLFRKVYGPRAEVYLACIQVPAYFGWIAAQYTALGQMQAIYFGIDLRLAILIACVVTLAYTLIGGMWSVTLTDTLQIVIAFLGLLIMGYSVFNNIGEGSATLGIEKVIVETWKREPQHLSLWPLSWGLGIWIVYLGDWAAGLFGNIPGQDLQQRIFASKSPRVAVQACVLAGVLYLTFGLIPVSMGLASRITDPQEIEGGILPWLAAKYLNKYLAVVFVISFTSIVVSTATSAVLAPATLLGHNLLGRLTLFQSRGLLRERLCVVLISLGGLMLAYSGRSIIGLLDITLSLHLVALFIPMAAALYGRPRTAYAAIIPMTVGAGLYFVRMLVELFVSLYVEHRGLELSWSDYLQQQLPACATWVAWYALWTEEAQGFLGGIVAYILVQWWYRHLPPINEEVRRLAWDRSLDPR
ncbi:MAG: sodium:solute symporter [Planctomycetaceae bacterium]|nr:MAG: sodium:solute symporter [Planctomycetaceae bacterium]